MPHASHVQARRRPAGGDGVRSRPTSSAALAASVDDGLGTAALSAPATSSAALGRPSEAGALAWGFGCGFGVGLRFGNGKGIRLGIRLLVGCRDRRGGPGSVTRQWTGDRACKDLVLDVADHVAHPLLSPKVVQRLVHVILTPTPAHKAHIPALQAAVSGSICVHRHVEVATREETEHEAADGAAPVLPLPTVNEDRGAEKDSDEDHLDGILHAMPPRARGTLPPTPADPQPLANAISVPCVIPEDMRQRRRRQEIQKRTWDRGQGHQKEPHRGQGHQPLGKERFLNNRIYIRSPSARINHVPDMLPCPLHRLHAIPNVDLAERRVAVLCCRHQAQATQGKQ